jgi:hypothetical protein
MSFMTLPVSGRGERIEKRPDVPEMSYIGPTGASAGYRVEFYLISLTVGVPGFTMTWTAPPRTRAADATNGAGHVDAHMTPAGDGDRFGGSDLRLVQEFSAVFTSGAATHAIQWGQMTSSATPGR